MLIQTSRATGPQWWGLGAASASQRVVDDAAMALRATPYADTEQASYGTEALRVNDALSAAATRSGKLSVARQDTWVGLVAAARRAVATL